MTKLRYVPRALVCAAVVLAAAFAASRSPASGASFTVPQVIKVEGRLAADNPIAAETHLLCMTRVDVPGTLFNTRSVCYSSRKPAGPPQLPITAFKSVYHQLVPGGLTGTGLAQLIVAPCSLLLPGTAVSARIDIQLDKGLGPYYGNYTLTFDTDAPFDCLPGPGTTAYTGPPLTATAQPKDHDQDGDGCTDWEELGPDQTKGGLRDPFNPWDYYDVQGSGGGPKDKRIDAPNDLLGVMYKYGLHQGDQGYDAAYDRGPRIGPNAWNLGPPDNSIDLPNDILGVGFSYQHNCEDPP